MRGRIDHLLEVARLAAKLLLSYAVAAWLLYLVLGMTMPALLARGNLAPFILAVLLSLPAPLLISRRRGRRNPVALETDWRALDPRDGGDLARFHQRLQQQTGLSPSARREWEGRLLAAWADRPRPAAAAELLSVRDLLFAQPRMERRELELLAGLPADRMELMDLLALWTRAAEEGLPLDHGVLSGLLRRLPAGRPPRRVRAVHPLLFRLAREGHAEASALLEGALRSRRLRLAQLPEDLRATLAGLAGAAAESGARLADSVAQGAGAAVRRVGARRREWPRWAAVAGAVIVVVVVGRLLTRPAPPTPAPPVSPWRYAPPAGADMGFTLQIMSSRDSAATARYVARIHDDSLYAYALAPRRNSSWYRVRLGWFAARAAADSVAAMLKSRGRIDEWYVANFDAAGRLHETLTGASDSIRAGASTTGAEGPSR